MQGEVDEEGPREHIAILAKRYLDENDSPNVIQTSRVLLKIRPTHVITQSGQCTRPSVWIE